MSRYTNCRVIQRVQIVSLHNSGIEKSVIEKFTGCSTSTVYRWSNHQIEKSPDDKKRSGCPSIFTDQVQLSLIGFYCQSSPLPGCGRWTIRWAERYLKEHSDVLGLSISRSSIHRILRKHNLKPHLIKYFLQITDPDFFPKMHHLLDLYNLPPEYLFFFDECPGIQILTRLAPNMTTKQQKKWLKEFEYNRNGTLDVFAFLEHKTGKVFAFHGSWLNLVEIWFGILNQKCLKESYKSTEDLIASINSFLDIWNTLLAHPFNWKYDGTGLHEKAVDRFINVISNECSPLPEKFLLKQLLLVSNLIDAYWNNVSIEVWVQLSNVLLSKQNYIKDNIENDDKPKRRAEAVTALHNLRKGLSMCLGNEQKKAS